MKRSQKELNRLESAAILAFGKTTDTPVDTWLSEADKKRIEEYKGNFSTQVRMLELECKSKFLLQNWWAEVTLPQIVKLIKPSWFRYKMFAHEYHVVWGSKKNSNSFRSHRFVNEWNATVFKFLHIDELAVRVNVDLLDVIHNLKKSCLFDGISPFGDPKKGVILGIMGYEQDHYVQPYKFFYIGSYGFDQ